MVSQKDRKYISTGLQGNKNVFHLHFTTDPFIGYHQSSVFLTRKSYIFFSRPCMEAISILVTPVSVSFPALLYSF